MNLLCVLVLVLCQSVKYLCSALRIAHQSNLRFPSHVDDLVDEGRDVLLAHVRPVKVPPLLQTPRPIFDVMAAVGCAPVIPNPYIVSLLREQARQTHLQESAEPSKP